MSTEVRTRLDPAIFRLPVDRIRTGYYSDAYFVLTKTLLESEGDHPHVTMQVFQKNDSILGGIDEALAILQHLLRATPRTAPGSTGWDQLVVHALHEGDRIAPRETVMTIEGDYSLFAHLETVYLGSLARRSLVMRNVARWSRRPAASRSSTSPPGTTTGWCRPATAGAPTSPARSASPPTPRRRGGADAAWGPCRTALISAYGGDTVQARPEVRRSFPRAT